MAHIKRIDLTRDVEAHAEAYRKAIENVCKETAFSGGKYADAFDKEFAAYVGSKFASVSTTVPPLCIWQCWHWV